MAALTSLGIVHTAISVVALAAGLVAVVRDHGIRPDNRVGQTFLWGTLASAVTGLFIYQHGGFGKPHVLSITTIVFLVVGAIAYRTTAFGAASRYVQAVLWSMCVFFHFIPGFTETGTRLPSAKPWFTSPEDPLLLKIVGGVFVIYAILQVLELRALRRRAR